MWGRSCGVDDVGVGDDGSVGVGGPGVGDVVLELKLKEYMYAWERG